MHKARVTAIHKGSSAMVAQYTLGISGLGSAACLVPGSGFDAATAAIMASTWTLPWSVCSIAAVCRCHTPCSTLSHQLMTCLQDEQSRLWRPAS
jgi:hypothetical protein